MTDVGNLFSEVCNPSGLVYIEMLLFSCIRPVNAFFRLYSVNDVYTIQTIYCFYTVSYKAPFK